MEQNNNKLILCSADAALTSFALSDPVAFVIVKLIKPQLLWVSPFELTSFGWIIVFCTMISLSFNCHITFIYNLTFQKQTQ